MAIEIKVPPMGESITEVTIDKWLVNEGDSVEQDGALAVIESDKATVELPAEVGGTLTKILKQSGETAQVGEIIAHIETGANGAPAEKPKTKSSASSKSPPAPAKTSTAAPAAPAAESDSGGAQAASHPSAPREQPVTARRSPAQEPPSKSEPANAPGQAPASPAGPVTPPQPKAPAPASSDLLDGSEAGDMGREEEVIPMTRLRRTLARRLVEAQQNAALLTTFNEIDMGSAMELRKQFGEAFQAKYQIKLGFMSFFVKAAIDALKLVPQVNGEVRGDNIIYKNYFDIAVAVGGGKGLVVPVIRNAERLSFAEIELAIGDFARRARENTLKPEELQGGTFTISNGGIYGSLLSTPIINPPQSGILGMHTIQERPVARAGQVVIRPMMYVALTYDHRIVDGREAVTFLNRIKEAIEDPARMLLEV